MRFITVKQVKLGNMRKLQDWTVTPMADMARGFVVMQCDARIARVDTNTGKATLSNGKGGHQGFMQLMPIMGAVEVDVPAPTLEIIKAAVAGRTDYHGPVDLVKLATG